MSKKDNFSQAAYEMFGIGRGGSKREADKTAEKPAESAAMDVEEDEMSLTVAPTVAEVKPLEKVPEKPKTTLLAEGSVFEGTLHTKGDVEIAGVFKGDIFSEGNVKLFANIEGNVQGGNVELVTSSVQGDVSAKELLKIGPQSVIGGNIKTKDMICSGRIVGNVESSGRVTLTTGSALTGDLTASTIAVMEGALMERRFKIVKKLAAVILDKTAPDVISYRNNRKDPHGGVAGTVLQAVQQVNTMTARAAVWLAFICETHVLWCEYHAHSTWSQFVRK